MARQATYYPVIDQKRLARVDISAASLAAFKRSMRDMLMSYPLLGGIASSDMISYHAVENVPFQWAATDGVAVYLNAGQDGFFAGPDRGFGDGNRIFVLGHEVLHIVMESVGRKHIDKTMGFVAVPKTHATPDGTLPFDNDTWERAEDARINDALITDKVGEPAAGVYLHPMVKWKTPFGEAYATIYQEKFGNPPPQQQPGNCQGPPPPGQGNQPQQGQTSNPMNDVLDPGQGGDPHTDTEDDPSADQPQDVGTAAADLAKGKAAREAMVQRAKQAARQMGAGTTTGEKLVDMAREPDVDWQHHIQGFLSRAAGNTAYDFSRAARPPILRDMLGLETYYSPARGGHGCEHVLFVGDVSGSISEKEHRVILSSIASALSALRPREFTILWCDDRIKRVDRDVTVDTDFSTYSIPQGGGTSFIPPFEWVKENCDGKPDGLIYFTDFYGHAPAEDPGFPVLWLATTDLKKPLRGGEWGDVVNVPVHELTRG